MHQKTDLDELPEVPVTVVRKIQQDSEMVVNVPPGLFA